MELALWLTVDWAGALMLLAAGVFGIRAWRRGPASAYWLLAGLGLIYLAFDERLSLHEQLGHLLWEAGVPDPPLVNHLDDAILMSFFLLGAAVTAACATEILSRPHVRTPFAVGVAFTVGALAIDAAAPVDGIAPRLEELVELGGEAGFFFAFRARFRAGPAPLAAPVPLRIVPAEAAAPDQAS
jgi:hypothetical protein